MYSETFSEYMGTMLYNYIGQWMDCTTVNMERLESKTQKCESRIEEIAEEGRSERKKIENQMKETHKQMRVKEKEIVELQEKVKGLEKKLSETRVESPEGDLAGRVDKLEKQMKTKNLVLMGVSSIEQMKEEVNEVVKEKLKVPIEEKDVSSILPVWRNIKGKRTLGAKIIFNNLERRRQLYKARTNLSGSSWWLSEDLTQKRLRR